MMELNSLLNQIDSLKKEADSLKPVKPEFEKAFWDKYRLEFNYNSNHLEGNTLTYGHTQLLLLFDKVVGDYSLRELEEMKAHDVALKMVIDEAQNKEHEISEKFIKEINDIILVRPFYKEAITPDGQPTRRLIEPGQYKKFPNSVRLENGEIFNYAPPEETPPLMGDLIEWYKKETKKKELHTVQIAALFHYRFVRIHPFDDSNGRTSRLMMNYILMKNGYAPLVIESTDKKNYLTALNRADTGDIEAFVYYITNQSLRWQNLYLNASKGNKIEEIDDFDKEVEILKRKQNSSQKVSIVFSTQIAITLFKESFYPLLTKIIEKLSSLDSFYFSKMMQFGFNGPTYGIHKTEKILQIVEEQQNKIQLNSSLDFQYIFKGLQTKDRGVINNNIYLKIRFNEFTYQISSEVTGGWFIEKKYNEHLSESETNQIVGRLARKALDYIKENGGV